MKEPTSFRRAGGFALIITLTLLALLLLAVVALSSLVRISGLVSSSGTYQTQARQHALLGLGVGLSDLQRFAGADNRVTAMAGISGLGAVAGNNTRHWCGVWQSDGAFLGWLASGAQVSAANAALQSSSSSIELIGTHTVGAAAANSEHVIAGKIPIIVSETTATPGAAATVGSYAYLVSDEGVKTAAYVPGPVPVAVPVVFSTSASSAAGKLRDAIASYSANLSKLLCYEQLKLLPMPGPALTGSVLQDNFHHVTLTSQSVNGAALRSGFFNPNTNSAMAWRSLLQTYNTAATESEQISSANVSAKGTTIQNTIAAFSTAGKATNGPFTHVASFGSFLATVFPASGSPTAIQIMTILGPMLTVRSDTFRLRAYGEVINPVDTTRVEAIAYCEAIVQRMPNAAPNGIGRNFVVIYFRWLGPDDI